MAATAQYLEKAYEKLFKFCSLEFRNLGRDAVLEVSTNLREGVKRLRQRPELLGYAASPHFQTEPMLIMSIANA